MPEPRAGDTTELPVDPTPAPTGDLTSDERAELERLRAQVAATRPCRRPLRRPRRGRSHPRAPLGRAPWCCSSSRPCWHRCRRWPPVTAPPCSTSQVPGDGGTAGQGPRGAGGGLTPDHRRGVRAAQGQGASRRRPSTRSPPAPGGRGHREPPGRAVDVRRADLERDLRFHAGPGEQARAPRPRSRTPGSPPTARRTPAWSPR